MESKDSVSGVPILVANKNSGSDRPAASGELGNQIPKDVILKENDRPCADVVGKMIPSDFKGTRLSPKVQDESEEELQPSGKIAKISGSNSRSELLGTGESDRLQAYQTPQSLPGCYVFDSEVGLFNPPSEAGSSSGSGLLGSGGNDRLQALQIPQSLPLVRDFYSEDGLVNPPSNAEEGTLSSVLPGNGDGLPRSGLPSFTVSALLPAGPTPENSSSNSIPLSGILRSSLSDEANANRQSGPTTRSQLPGRFGLGSSSTATSTGADSPRSGVSTTMDNILLQAGDILSSPLTNSPTLPAINEVMSNSGENSAIFGVDVSDIHASSSTMAPPGRRVNFSSSVDNDNPVSPPRYWTQQDQISGLAAPKSRKKVQAHKVVRVRKSSARKIYTDILDKVRKTMKLSVADVDPHADPEAITDSSNEDEVAEDVGDMMVSTEGEDTRGLVMTESSDGISSCTSANANVMEERNEGGPTSSSSSCSSSSEAMAAATMALTSPFAITSVNAGHLTDSVQLTTHVNDMKILGTLPADQEATSISDPKVVFAKPWADYEDDDDDYDYGSSYSNISSGQGPTDALNSRSMLGMQKHGGNALPLPDDLILSAKRKGDFDTETSDGTYVAADWVKFYSYQLFIDVVEWNDITISNIIVNDMTSGMVHNVLDYIRAGWSKEDRFHNWSAKKVMLFILDNRIDVTPSQKCMTGMTMPRMIIRAFGEGFFNAAMNFPVGFLELLNVDVDNLISGGMQREDCVHYIKEQIYEGFKNSKKSEPLIKWLAHHTNINAPQGLIVDDPEVSLIQVDPTIIISQWKNVGMVLYLKLVEGKIKPICDYLTSSLQFWMADKIFRTFCKLAKEEGRYIPPGTVLTEILVSDAKFSWSKTILNLVDIINLVMSESNVFFPADEIKAQIAFYDSQVENGRSPQDTMMVVRSSLMRVMGMYIEDNMTTDIVTNTLTVTHASQPDYTIAVKKQRTDLADDKEDWQSICDYEIYRCLTDGSWKYIKSIIRDGFTDKMAQDLLSGDSLGFKNISFIANNVKENLLCELALFPMYERPIKLISAIEEFTSKFDIDYPCKQLLQANRDVREGRFGRIKYTAVDTALQLLLYPVDDGGMEAEVDDMNPDYMDDTGNYNEEDGPTTVEGVPSLMNVDMDTSGQPCSTSIEDEELRIFKEMMSDLKLFKAKRLDGGVKLAFYGDFLDNTSKADRIRDHMDEKEFSVEERIDVIIYCAALRLRRTISLGNVEVDLVNGMPDNDKWSECRARCILATRNSLTKEILVKEMANYLRNGAGLTLQITKMPAMSESNTDGGDQLSGWLALLQAKLLSEDKYLEEVTPLATRSPVVRNQILSLLSDMKETLPNDHPDLQKLSELIVWLSTNQGAAVTPLDLRFKLKYIDLVRQDPNTEFDITIFDDAKHPPTFWGSSIIDKSTHLTLRDAFKVIFQPQILVGNATHVYIIVLDKPVNLMELFNNMIIEMAEQFANDYIQGIGREHDREISPANDPITGGRHLVREAMEPQFTAEYVILSNITLALAPTENDNRKRLRELITKVAKISKLALDLTHLNSQINRADLIIMHTKWGSGCVILKLAAPIRVGNSESGAVDVIRCALTEVPPPEKQKADSKKREDKKVRIYSTYISDTTEKWLRVKSNHFLITGTGTFNMAEMEASRIAFSQYMSKVLANYETKEGSPVPRFQVTPMTCTHQRTRNKFTVFPLQPVFMVTTNFFMSPVDRKILLAKVDGTKFWYEGLRVDHRGWLYQLYIDLDRLITSKPDLGFLCQKREHIRIECLKIGNIGQVLDIVCMLLKPEDIYYIYRRIRQDPLDMELVICVKKDTNTDRVVNDTEGFTHLSSTQTVSIKVEDCLPKKHNIDWYKDWNDFPVVATAGDSGSGPSSSSGSGGGSGRGAGNNGTGNSGTGSSGTRNTGAGRGDLQGRGARGSGSQGSTAGRGSGGSSGGSSGVTSGLTSAYLASPIRPNAWTAPPSISGNPGSANLAWATPSGTSEAPFTDTELQMFSRFMQLISSNQIPLPAVTPVISANMDRENHSASLPGTAPGTGNE